MRLKTLSGAAAAAAGGAFLYSKFLRQPILTWGATAEEAAARLPGDELLEEADGVATRAITIEAPRSAVWPWIAQMGPSPRGGAYTYEGPALSCTHIPGVAYATGSASEKPVLEGVMYELCPRGEVELALDVLAVELCGSNGDVQQRPDLSVRVSEREVA